MSNLDKVSLVYASGWDHDSSIITRTGFYLSLTPGGHIMHLCVDSCQLLLNFLIILSDMRTRSAGSGFRIAYDNLL